MLSPFTKMPLERGDKEIDDILNAEKINKERLLKKVVSVSQRVKENKEKLKE